LLQKILLHSELANLGVKLFDPRLVVLLGLLGLARKADRDLLLARSGTVS